MSAKHWLLCISLRELKRERRVQLQTPPLWHLRTAAAVPVADPPAGAGLSQNREGLSERWALPQKPVHEGRPARDCTIVDGDGYPTAGLARPPRS